MSSTTNTEAQTITTTQTLTQNEDGLVLHLTSQPETAERPHVSWTTDTVDNEFANKKKSKCCCIYKKPKNWQDSSSDSDSDCETGHCRGHVEQKNNSIL